MTSINLEQLKKMIVSGANYITANYEYINQLNIFPVPDGDTGSNLRITVEGAVNNIENKEFSSLSEFGKTYARALLMNARGNSGVIFSQIMKGFVANFKNDTKELTLGEISSALNGACDFAYKSLASPIEGTILTVIRLTAENYAEKANTFKSVEEAFKFIVDTANEALNKTPEMLEELKQAKVVDSGGFGLVKFLEGMYNYLIGKEKIESKQLVEVKQISVFDNFVDNNEGFGYCCEFIMLLGSKVTLNQKEKEEFIESKLKRELEAIGDSLVLVVDENMVKVHLHTIEPYRLLQIGAKYGEFSKIKIENMTLQFAEKNPDSVLGATYNKPETNKELKTKQVLLPKAKIIATVPTTTLSDLYKNQLKVDHMINCEDSGNPSIQEFLDAFKKVKSSQITLVVHDSNIVLGAKEAAALVKNTIKVTIVNAKDISVSYLCCLAYNPLDDYDNNLEKLKIISNKTFGKVAQANKDVVYFRVKIKAGHYIGLINKNVVTSNKSILTTTKNIVDQVKNDRTNKRNKSDKIYLFVGADVKIEDIRNMEKYVAETYQLKTEIIKTDQTLYFFNIVY